ncbi:hypothetical protein OQ279_14975 [Salinimicrobium sp. MT39]|uniref:RHS repeat protein n=1 Tax=Salinimicrobium profundisediminis TaxID=2994553 RepID=A0A9X3I2Z4_9FLAO|nr:hypothetical protein [Salinimicrobium profundisediminis]MCX2839452.1 hypothetical protein [Salinimicrobium profundisediminis]
MKNIIIYSFLIFSIVLHSQELPQVVPQTPDAAALSKYSEYPLGNFTGVPEIFLPLYTIKSGDIELPIGLNYHAGGFKVSEEASWVGLGWTLTINGAITRTVKGVEDFIGSVADQTSPYHSSPKIIDIVDNCSGGSLGNTVDCYNVPGGNNFNGSGERAPAISSGRSNLAQVDGQIVDYSHYIGGLFDWEPDIYAINFMDLQGKFVLDQEKNIHFLDKKDLEIRKTEGGWMVRKNDGSQYFFEKKETSKNYYGKEVNGSWYITKYISPNKRELKFYYSQDTFPSWQKSYGEVSTVRGGDQDFTFFIDQKNFSDIRTQKLYLKRIEWDNGYLVLNANSLSREDLKDGKSLKTIGIYNNHNKVIREFEFETDYFESNNSLKGYMENLPTEEYSYYRKRLRLNKITEKSGLEERKYQFEYSAINLPNKDSFSQDHWGYYNGRANSNLIPSFEGPLPYNQLKLISDSNNSPIGCNPPLQFSTERTYRIRGSNRETNPTVIGANILHKITYPTGGSTSFEFEANEYATNSTDAVFVDYTQDIRKISRKGQLDSEYSSISMPFNLPSDSQGVSNAEVSFVITSTGSPIIFNNNMWAEFNSSNYSKRYYANVTPNSGGYSFTDTNLPDNITGPIDLSFNIPEMDNNQSAYLTFKCRIKKKIDKKYTGGLRVKKIIHSEVESNEGQMIKTYEYGYKVNTPEGQKDLSYGVLKVPNRYWTMFYGTPASGCYNTIRFSSSFHNNLSLSQNSHVGYSKIIEKNGINGENGTTTYNYHNNVNINYATPISQEFIPSSIEFYLDGKLKSTSISDGNKKIHEKFYEYTRLDEVIISSVFQDGYNPFGSSTWYGNGRFHYYPIFSRWEPLTSLTEYSYNSTNGDPIVTKVLYEYNEQNLLPSIISSIDSQGNHIKTKNYYPHDVVNVNSLGEPLDYSTEYLPLINLKKKGLNGSDADFKTAIPVQVEKYKNETLLSRSRTIFKRFSNSSLTLPTTVQVSKNGNLLEDRILYTNYDIYGNHIEVSKADGSKISYIWGYNGQYPVAKIENASYSDIASAIGISISSLNDYNESNVGIINNLRSDNKLPQALITTYTYEPLVGLRSTTDPKGLTTYYEYDAFNRLEFIKDQDQNIISEYGYHYKTQN